MIGLATVSAMTIFAPYWTISRARGQSVKLLSAQGFGLLTIRAAATVAHGPWLYAMSRKKLARFQQ